MGYNLIGQNAVMLKNPVFVQYLIIFKIEDSRRIKNQIMCHKPKRTFRNYAEIASLGDKAG